MTVAAAAGYPFLVGDIGGTNVRFGVLDAPGAPLALLPRALTREHDSPIAALRAALGAGGAARPRSALLAVASRVDAATVHLTNAGWTVDAAAIGAAFGFRSVELVNDFVPVAASLSLGGEEKELVRIGPECPACPGARLVLGPGTGFGAAALLPMGERWAIHSTEAGHTDFGPAEPDEAALWPLLDRVAGRVTAEAVLSGPGLLRLYRALGQSRSAAAPCRTAEEVSAAALARDDALATEALQLFARLLGRFAGDLALTFGAGAVYLGGGIAPKIATVLSAGEFRRAFERKAPFEHWMRAVPTFLIADPDPALTGLCAILADPGRFTFRSAIWRREPG
ncbi:MAG: glucokinase [Microvirga sp.]